MDTGSATERFFAGLGSLYAAAGRPTLEGLVRHCEGQRPPITTSTTTIGDWLNGKAVPGARSERAFSQIVIHLQRETRRRGGDPSAHLPQNWSVLLVRARAEKRANRGGRPRRPRARPAGGPKQRWAPMTLPPDPADFTGRSAALVELGERLVPGEADATVTVVTGMGGAGKTALAVRAAHRAVRGGRFTGGVLFLDVRGYSQESPLEAGNAAERLLRMLGTGEREPSGTTPETVGMWRTALAGSARTPLLIVLDNVASASQVSPLLPDSPHRLVITSRSTLSALPAHRIDLLPLGAEEAVELLDRALRRTFPGDDRVTASPEDARELAELCGRLPLALRIVAALLRDDPHQTLSAQAADLAEARDRLDRLRYDDADDQGRSLAVRAAFDLSHARLDVEQKRAFDLLGVVPGPDVGLEAAADLLDRPLREAERLLSGLTRLHLLQGHPGRRWDMHDLVRIYASEHAHADPGRYRSALIRLLEHHERATTDASRRLISPKALVLYRVNRFSSREPALRWLDAEHANVAAAIAAAHRAEVWSEAYETAIRLSIYHEFRRHTEEWVACARVALEAAEHLGPEQICQATLTLGNAHRAALRYDEAERHLRRALELAPDPLAEGRARHNLGLVYFKTGEYDKAAACHRTDLRICTEAQDELGAGQSLSALGDALRMLGNYEEAAAALERAIDISERFGDAENLMNARNNLGLVLLNWNPVLYGGCGIWHQCHALRTARERDDRYGEAMILGNLGVLYLNMCPACHGRAAVRCATRAVTLHEKHREPLFSAYATRTLGLGLLAVGELEDARRTLDRATAALQVLGALPEDGMPDSTRRPAHISGCRGRRDPARFRWLDELPEEVLRGDFGTLESITWIDFRYLVGQ